MNRSITLIICLLLTITTQAQWQSMYQSQAGRNVAIHFWDKQNGIVCGVWSPFIVKTNDGGRNWDTVTVDFFNQTSVNLIEMQFPARNIGFICGGSGFSPYMNILMRTLDGGNTWDSVIVNRPDTWEFQGIDIHIANNQLSGVLHTYADVYRVDDTGKTLVPLQQPSTGFGMVSEAVLVNGTRVLVSTGTEILKTDNWGGNWTRVYSDTDYFGKMSFHERKGIAIGSEGWILRTSNMGDSWVKEQIDSDSASFYTVKHAPNGDAYILGGIAQRGYVYGYGNEGQYWSKVLVDPDFEYFADISMPTRDTGYIATSRHVLKTTTGGGLALTIADLSPASDGIKLYPNPANDKLYVDMPADKKLRSIMIYDATGKLTGRYSGRAVDVSAMCSGSYIITIETDKGSFSKRLSVQ